MITPDDITEESKLVTKWLDRIKSSIRDNKKTFDKITECQQLTRYGHSKDWAEANKYVANFLQNHIQMRTSKLYAKNPKFVAKRKRRIDFKIWDGTQESLQAAIQNVNNALGLGVMPKPQSIALLEDVTQGNQQKQTIDKLGKTVEILFAHYISEQGQTFKKQLKQMIRRVLIDSVGYVQLDFQRERGYIGTVAEQIRDMRGQIAHIESLQYDVSKDSDESKLEELQNALSSLEQEDVILREGLVFDFPKSTSIIIDPNCVDLKTFEGARWLAREYSFSTDEIKDRFGVDVSAATATEYSHHVLGANKQPFEKTRKENPRTYRVWDKATGTSFVVCDGFKGYLEAPKAPDVSMERFFPIFSLTFNDIEDDENIYPDSNIWLLRHAQLEHNRSREGLRQHRIANQPFYVSSVPLDESDKEKLSTRVAHEVLELRSLKEGQDVTSALAPVRLAGIDPNLYSVNHLYEDVERSVGADSADFGGTSNATATEAGIAQGNRVSSIESNRDDLDDMLSEIARSASSVLLQNLDIQTVQKIAGRGAIWPQFSSKELADEIFLDVEAGSSGRPNKAQDLANMDRIMPHVIQMPGARPEFWINKLIQLLDENIELADAYADGLPSIIAGNALQNAQQGGGGLNNPVLQGAQGAMNGARPTNNQPQNMNPEPEKFA